MSKPRIFEATIIMELTTDDEFENSDRIAKLKPSIDALRKEASETGLKVTISARTYQPMERTKGTESSPNKPKPTKTKADVPPTE